MSKQFSRIFELALRDHLRDSSIRPGELAGVAVYTSREDGQRRFPCADVAVDAALGEAFLAADGEYEGTLALTVCTKADDTTGAAEDGILAALDGILRGIDALADGLATKAAARGWTLSLHEMWQEAEESEPLDEQRLNVTTLAYRFVSHGKPAAE